MYVCSCFGGLRRCFLCVKIIDKFLFFFFLFISVFVICIPNFLCAQLFFLLLFSSFFIFTYLPT